MLQMEAGKLFHAPSGSCDGAVPDRFSGICEAPRKLLAQIGAVVELKAETPAGKAKKHSFWGAPGDETGSFCNSNGRFFSRVWRAQYPRHGGVASAESGPVLRSSPAFPSQTLPLVENLPTAICRRVARSENISRITGAMYSLNRICLTGAQSEGRSQGDGSFMAS